jgi:hypothetical protein
VAPERGPDPREIKPRSEPAKGASETVVCGTAGDGLGYHAGPVRKFWNALRRGGVWLWAIGKRWLRQARGHWATWLRNAVVGSGALLWAIAILALLDASVRWWILNEDEKAVHAVIPIRYLLNHPPTASLLGLVGGVAMLLAFFRPFERFIENLKKGPFGTEAHPEVVEKRPNPEEENASASDDD